MSTNISVAENNTIYSLMLNYTISEVPLELLTFQSVFLKLFQ